MSLQFRGQDFSRTPEEASSSARNSSKAGGTEGERWALGLPQL